MGNAVTTGTDPTGLIDGNGNGELPGTWGRPTGKTTNDTLGVIHIALVGVAAGGIGVAASGETYAIGLAGSSASPVGSHMSFGWASGTSGVYTWGHGLGYGYFTTTAAATGGQLTLGGIPVLYPEAVGAWVATKPAVGNCVVAAGIGLAKGWGF